MQALWKIYHDEMPEFLNEFLQLDIMKRIQNVGMNCGCEYTQFPLFINLKEYSRYTHSVGCALIVWHFTEDRKQTLAALFHDVATPAFSHVIDFLHRDHMNQESTEEKTLDILKGSDELMHLLGKYEISVEEIADYHLYPIADNDTPMLSSDRLEYTLSNLYNYGFCTLDEIRTFYQDLCVSTNELGDPEICFQSADAAERFSLCTLETSKIYVADADRLIMQLLADLIECAVKWNVLCEDDLYIDENHVISKLLSNEKTAAMWKSFCQLKSVKRALNKPESGSYRLVVAKKRWINPRVASGARVNEFSSEFSKKANAFLMQKFDEYLVTNDEIPYL